MLSKLPTKWYIASHKLHFDNAAANPEVGSCTNTRNWIYFIVIFGGLLFKMYKLDQDFLCSFCSEKIKIFQTQVGEREEHFLQSVLIKKMN